ncbi:MAG: ester cyclase [Rhodocyclaceae bacterium]|nr:ester cyclase [Rhodocyclaceae bacterium]
MAGTNHDALSDFIEVVFNRGDTEAADGYFEPSLVDHAPWPDQPATVAGFKAGLAELRSSFPDLRMVLERTVVEGDLVVGHCTMSGTHLGEFMGAAPSGRTFSVEAIDIVRMRDGRIAEHWGVVDEAGIARQLGLSA